MNREIKFRAWVKDEDKMVYSKQSENFISLDGSYYVIIYNLANPKKMILKKEEDNNIELMQYTGLKDKNGIEIYEGDKIKVVNTEYDNSETIQTIEYKESGYWIDVDGYDFDMLPIGCANDEYYILEVIGNIYENKELLEASNEQ